MARYVVGAYAASPCTDGWNPELESRFFAALDEAGFVSGLELPFAGKIHAHDPEWLIRNIRRDWSIVLTAIPGTMGKLGADPEFGLASSSDAGRGRALDFAASSREAVVRLNEGLGRRAVIAVEIHSAPRPSSGVEPTAEAFRRSLDELRGWDWQGAVLSIEHCDRFVPGQTPEKGFLALASEIVALRASAGVTPVGVAINWGRSAIEARSAEVPLLHIQQAREQGVLNGLIFSGAASADPLYGDWADRHVPFGSERDAHRLLTPARARACLAAVKGLPLAFLGFKIQTLPKELGVPERVDVLRRTAQILDEAVS
jgi:hypothetical protein